MNPNFFSDANNLVSSFASVSRNYMAASMVFEAASDLRNDKKDNDFIIPKLVAKTSLLGMIL